LVLVMALMLVGSLYPVVEWLEQRRVRRVFAIWLVFAVGTALAGTLAVFTVPTVIEQVKALAENEPRIRETIAGYLEGSYLTAPPPPPPPPPPSPALLHPPHHPPLPFPLPPPH